MRKGLHKSSTQKTVKRNVKPKIKCKKINQKEKRKKG